MEFGHNIAVIVVAVGTVPSAAPGITAGLFHYEECHHAAAASSSSSTSCPVIIYLTVTDNALLVLLHALMTPNHGTLPTRLNNQTGRFREHRHRIRLQEQTTMQQCCSRLHACRH